ncbi:hypothetical protein HPP92_003989 [Vanilla planifolia]|uniref:Uncharacterized protein n=1 Tax=Vanilla planifolia TaxID=51239 RepID=A0A835VM04_VANPL|nr:hypothetical protein HPP92_003989 [Vanilla planifolia]
MEASLFAFAVLLLSFAAVSFSGTETVVLDDLIDRGTSNLHLGDSLVFKHRHLQNLYLFHTRGAFELCDFGDATLIYKDGSAFFKWTPARPGHYYFSAKDESLPSCEQAEKLLVRVVDPEISPALPPDGESAPPPTAGGDIPSSPSLPIVNARPPSTAPEEPNEGWASAVPPPESGGGIPFISSNPAVPLPTGETDAATLRPLPTPSDGAPQMVGFAVALRVQKLRWVMEVIMTSALCLAL